MFEFFDNIRGSIAPAAAIIVLPVCMSVGMAVDYSRISQMDVKAQDALDAAVLAGAHETTKPQAENAIRNYFAASFLMAR